MKDRKNETGRKKREEINWEEGKKEGLKGTRK